MKREQKNKKRIKLNWEVQKSGFQGKDAEWKKKIRE